MNKNVIFRLLLGGLCVILSVSSFAQASKGLKSLEKNRFDEAFQAFQSSMENPGEVPMAYYGFSLLYSAPTYPGYNIDTAYVNALRAEQTFRKLDYKLKGKLSKKMTLADIRLAKKEIAQKAYQKYEEVNSLEGWDYFLSNYKKPGYKVEKNAQIQRNKIAYELAKSVNTYEAFGKVLAKYRKSMASKSPAILKQVESALLELYMKDHSWEDFDQFAADYPYHSFVRDSSYYELSYLDEANDIEGMFALLNKYKKSSFSNVITDYLAASLPTNGNYEECEQFVQLKPNHPDGLAVWERYYRFYRKKHPRYQDILDFEKKYPNTPIDQLISDDKVHFADKRFEIVMEKNDPRAFKGFIEQFPDYPKVKEVEDLYFKKALEKLDGEPLSVLNKFEKNNPSVVKQSKWDNMKKQALDDYFDKIGEVEDRSEILKAIYRYPDHSQVGRAWETFYERYKEEEGEDESSLDDFLNKYPSFPYPELIVQDKKKIIEDDIDMALDMGTWKDCIQLARENSGHPKVTALWRKGLDDFLGTNPSYKQLMKFKITNPDCPMLDEVDKAIKKAEKEYLKPNDDEKAKPKTTEGIFGLVNTSYKEYVPVISADGRYLYFCRKLTNEDIYVSEMKNDQWQEAVPIFELNNLGYTNESPLTISSDGNKMLVFLDGNIAETIKTANGWSEPKKLPSTFNDAIWQSDAVYSGDGKVILFTKENFSGKDLFISHRKADDTWSEAEKLPAPINTSVDERSPFLHPNMKTLYFSSARDGGFGDLDVYVSERIGEGWDHWSEPVNLGETVNSAKYDWGFRVTTDGTKGYYNKQNSGDSDFFMVSLKEEFQAQKITSISGFVKGKKGAGIGAEIVWTLLETGREVQVTTSDPSDGSFFATLPEKGLYGYTIEKKGYFPLSGNIEVTDESVNFVLEKELVLVTIDEIKEEGLNLPLNNLFFDTGKYAIKKASFPDLIRLSEWVRHHDLSITIIGHTDNVGEDDANLILSQNRAKAVKDFLVSVGLDAAMIHTIGKGAKEPIESNDTKTGRHANRRVEIRIK